jgi:hypothetical protein
VPKVFGSSRLKPDVNIAAFGVTVLLELTEQEGEVKLDRHCISPIGMKNSTFLGGANCCNY